MHTLIRRKIQSHVSTKSETIKISHVQNFFVVWSRSRESVKEVIYENKHGFHCKREYSPCKDSTIPSSTLLLYISSSALCMTLRGIAM